MEKRNKVQCPSCGSESIAIEEREDTAQAVFGPKVAYKEIVYKCNECDFSFTDEDAMPNGYIGALEQSRKQSVGLILDSLSRTGYSMAAAERALELPARTLSRWKSGQDLSAAALALLRIINIYPWVIEVADSKYDERYAKVILGKYAMATMHDLAMQSGYSLDRFHTYATFTDVGFHVNYRKNAETVLISDYTLPQSINSEPANITGVMGQ